MAAPAVEFQKVDEINPYKNVSGYDPAQVAVDPAKDTVQGQIADITKKGGPLFTLARTGAKQTANKVGLLNSSMAAGAGEKAVLETALPIAQQDAATYYDSSKTNAAAKNVANSEALRGRQQMEGTAAQGYENRLTLKAEGKENQTIQQMRNDVDLQLQQLRTQADLIVGAQQSMGQAFSAANIAIGDILSNPDIPEAAKQSQVNKVLEGLNNQMAWVGKASGLDFSNILVFPGAATGTTAGTTGTATPAATTAPPANQDTVSRPMTDAAAGNPVQTTANNEYTDDRLRETIRLIKAEDTDTQAKIAKLAGVIKANNIDPQRVADILGVSVDEVKAEVAKV